MGHIVDHLSLADFLQIMFDENPEAATLLADFAHVKPETVASWHRGTARPTKKQCLAIAAFFEYDPDAIVKMAQMPLVTLH